MRSMPVSIFRCTFARTPSADAARLMCLTGINGMHTIWTGGGSLSSKHPMKFSQRDRVTADYAGWVKAGADRVLELLGAREGVVTVYGDVHNGCLIENHAQRVLECSFGPIGRSGGRGLIPGFGPQMKDVDGRDVSIHALYHKSFANAEQQKHAAAEPFYWNFLEMEFDTRPVDPQIGLRVRNLIDAPQDAPRGGGAVQRAASTTGRPHSCGIGVIRTLPNADVRFTKENGQPIRAIRSLQDGTVPLQGFADIPPGTRLILTAYDGQATDSQIITTRSV